MSIQSTAAVEVTHEAGRIYAQCLTCKNFCDAPDKGLGRARVVAFLSQHQHSN